MELIILYMTKISVCPSCGKALGLACHTHASTRGPGGLLCTVNTVFLLFTLAIDEIF